MTPEVRSNGCRDKKKKNSQSRKNKINPNRFSLKRGEDILDP